MTPEVIDEFTWKDAEGDTCHSLLSNYFIEPDGTCVECEFQAEKTWDLTERVAILTASPGEAKRLGRKAKLRPDWDDVKVNVMRGLVMRKFLDHPELAEQLVSQTGDAFLVEGNWWHDNFWGVCKCGSCSSKTHANFNNLGIILMEVRDLIVSFG